MFETEKENRKIERRRRYLKGAIASFKEADTKEIRPLTMRVKYLISGIRDLTYYLEELEYDNG